MNPLQRDLLNTAILAIIGGASGITLWIAMAALAGTPKFYFIAGAMLMVALGVAGWLTGEHR